MILSCHRGRSNHWYFSGELQSYLYSIHLRNLKCKFVVKSEKLTFIGIIIFYLLLLPSFFAKRWVCEFKTFSYNSIKTEIDHSNLFRFWAVRFFKTFFQLSIAGTGHSKNIRSVFMCIKGPPFNFFSSHLNFFDRQLKVSSEPPFKSRPNSWVRQPLKWN